MCKTVVKLHLPTFLNNIKAAAKNKTLTANADRSNIVGLPSYALCIYKNEDGLSCIVGAGLRGAEGFEAITESEDLNAGTSFTGLVENGYIDVPEKYKGRIEKLQQAYDSLVRRGGKSIYAHGSNLRHLLRHLELTARKDFPEAYAN